MKTSRLYRRLGKVTLVGLLGAWSVATAAYGASAEFKRIMGDAVYHLDFDKDGYTPQIGTFAPIPDADAVLEKGRSGLGFKSADYLKLHFSNSLLIDPDTAGTLLLWVSPKKWIWSDDRPINTFLATPGGSGTGQLSISRQGYQSMDGQLVRLEAIHLVIAMPDIPEMIAPQEPPTPETWTDGSWHLLALSWSGSSFSFSVDGGPEREVDLGRPLDVREISTFFIGGCAEETILDDFMIFRRRLSSEEILAVYEELKITE